MVSCGLGTKKVIVKVEKPVIDGDGNITGYLPISGANIKIITGYINTENKTTDSNGLAEMCVAYSTYITVKVAHSMYDFGSGISNEHQLNVYYAFDDISLNAKAKSIILPCIGSINIDSSLTPNLSNITKPPTSFPITLSGSYTNALGQTVYNFDVAVYIDGRYYGTKTNTTQIDLLSTIRDSGGDITSAHTIEFRPVKTCNIPTARFNYPGFIIPQALLCTDTLQADSSQIYSQVQNLTSAPSMLLIPISTRTSKRIPVEISVDGRPAGTAYTGQSINILNILQTIGFFDGLKSTTSHTVTITSQEPNCNIPPISFIVPAIIPQIPKVLTSCTDFIIKVEQTPSVPDVLPAPNMPFFVYIRGVKEVCSSDPTNPSLIKSFNGQGNIQLGDKTAVFNIINGVADFDLMKLLGGINTPEQPTQPIYLPLPITTPVLPEKPTMPTSGTWSNSSEIIQYLPNGYTIEDFPSFGGVGSVKLIRPDGSYAYANKWSGIKSIIGV